MDNPAVVRNSKDSKERWQSLAQRYQANPGHLGALVKEAKQLGLDPTSFQGENPTCNLLYDLNFFNGPQQLVVDVFHNMNEGHCNLLYDFFRVLTPFAEERVKVAWEDDYVWDPTVGEYVS